MKIAQQHTEDTDLCAAGVAPNGDSVNWCKEESSGWTRYKSLYMPPARKAMHLRVMALWLGESRDFSRFDNYGCHCLADLSKGYGQPVDATDRACKSLQQCYECSKLGTSTSPPIETCDPATVKYKYQLRVKTDTGERSIRCRKF